MVTPRRDGRTQDIESFKFAANQLRHCQPQEEGKMAYFSSIELLTADNSIPTPTHYINHQACYCKSLDQQAAAANFSRSPFLRDNFVLKKEKNFVVFAWVYFSLIFRWLFFLLFVIQVSVNFVSPPFLLFCGVSPPLARFFCPKMRRVIPLRY